MPPQTVVTGTQIPLDQAQIDYWLGQLQGNQRGQNFGLGSNILDFITNRDRNRAGANAAYGQLGTSIAALNASQRGQLASAQQAAIQMLADRTGPQNGVVEGGLKASQGLIPTSHLRAGNRDDQGWQGQLFAVGAHGGCYSATR